MWLIIMFDCPTVSNPEKRAAARFRNSLLDQGFSMSQFSVYFRFLPSKEAAERHKKTTIPLIPKGGRVQFLLISDTQFGNMATFYGPLKLQPPKAPEQLLLF